MKIDNFFSELKRRNVLKVALVYAVVSWLLFELAWILLPTFEAPEWVLPAVVVLLVLGRSRRQSDRKQFRRNDRLVATATGALRDILAPLGTCRLPTL